MTIVACDGAMMAADSASFAGAWRTISVRPKITRRRDGALIGCAGEVPCIDAYREWFMGGEDATTKPVMKLETGDLEALIVRPDGTIWRVGTMMQPYRVTAPTAIGNTDAVMMTVGAMHAGATAEAAVRIACEHTIYVGGAVQVERFRPANVAPISDDEMAQIGRGRSVADVLAARTSVTGP